MALRSRFALTESKSMTTSVESGLTATPALVSERIASLDQFRGYTVAGMLLVNFVGGFAASPALLKHSNDYCSYADTIMPQFLFAVGFAFRLTFGRRMQRQGSAAAYGRMVRRLLGLVLISLVIYTVSAPAGTWQQLVEAGPWEVVYGPLKRNWFQTLMHIAVTSLWLLPVIQAGAAVRRVITNGARWRVFPGCGARWRIHPASFSCSRANSSADKSSMPRIP
jgi:predicted acyltransferase